MHMTVRRLTQLTAMAVVAIAVAALAAPVWADPGDFVNCQQHPTAPECVVNPSSPGGPGGGSGGSGGGAVQCRDGSGRAVPCFIAGKGFFGGDGCWYQPATGSDLAAAEALGGPATPPERWYIGACGDPLSNLWPATLVKFRLFGGQGPGIDVLADEAVKRLVLPAPAIRVNPAPPTPQVVYVPTWLWVDRSSWGERSASAAAGGLTVTATAKPTKAAWSMGDGTSLTCPGPGTPWTSGANPAQASPTCGHTYRHAAAPGGTFTIRATVTWSISWAGGGETGTRPALTTTALVQLRVTEAGALNSNGAET